jgi:hypothetical protein
MKKVRFLWFMLLFGCLIGCIPEVDEGVTLSFWTDRALFEDGFKMVFVNDTYIGDLGSDLESPICGDVGLLHYQMQQAEDLLLTVRNGADDSIEIGIVNLYSVSRGIKIKPSNDSEIFVGHSVGDPCTLVYLNWK